MAKTDRFPRALLAAVFISWGAFAFAETSAPVSFFDSGLLPKGLSRYASKPAEKPSGRELFESLHDLSGRGYRENDYDAARRYMFSTADNVTVGGVRGVLEAYSQTFVAGTSGSGGDYPEPGDQNGDGYNDKDGMNAEHVWPQSFFGKRLPMKSDLHHLLPTFIYPNGMRGILPFGEVAGKGEYSNSAGAKIGQGIFEPPNGVKGRVARAMLYFYLRYHDRNISNGGYGDDFWNKKIELLMRWNRTFPPEESERRRNELVEKFQGNRNPFVDEPALADRVGADVFRRVSRWN